MYKNVAATIQQIARRKRAQPEPPNAPALRQTPKLGLLQKIVACGPLDPLASSVP